VFDGLSEDPCSDILQSSVTFRVRVPVCPLVSYYSFQQVRAPPRAAEPVVVPPKLNQI